MKKELKNPKKFEIYSLLGDLLEIEWAKFPFPHKYHAPLESAR
jgi:hypothetical protein